LPEKPDYSDTRIILPKVHVMAVAKWKKRLVRWNRYIQVWRDGAGES